VIYERDATKATANLKKHGIAFEDTATVFLDAFALTYPDPDDSAEEQREITIGHTMKEQLVFVAHCERGGGIRIISARFATRRNVNNMKKQSTKAIGDDLRKEYDLSLLKGGVRGKYFRRSTAGTNLVLIEPDLTDVFPDSESVNRALRLLADTARVAMSSKRRGRR